MIEAGFILKRKLQQKLKLIFFCKRKYTKN